VVEHLQAVAHHALRELGRPLVFIGPVFNKTLSPPSDRYWTRVIREEMVRLETPFVDLCDFSLGGTPDRFDADGFHVNRNGHRIVGERFAATVENQGLYD
jgi:lysophospholipase L1-like esterase